MSRSEVEITSNTPGGQTIESSGSDGSPGFEPILFLHLPKTAGTALRNLFVRHLGESNVSKALNMRLDEALVRYAGLQAICGHFHPEQGQRLPSDRISITILREPIDRFLSYFYFLKFDAQGNAIDQRIRTMEIDQFVDEMKDGSVDDLNLQTSLLYPLGTESLAMMSWPERVASAKRALDRIDYVGIHAEIVDFVCMISARMRWPAESVLDRINVTSQRMPANQLAPATRRKLEDLLQYDTLVYEYAVERFRQLRRAAIVAAGVRESGMRPVALPNGATKLPQRLPAFEPREFGDRRLELINVQVGGEMSGAELALIGERIRVHIDFVAHVPLDQVTVGFLIRDDDGLPVYGTNTYLLGDIHRVTPGRYSFEFSLVNRVECGAYTVDIMLIRNTSHLEGCYHWKDKAARFDVNGWATGSFNGRVMMDACASFAKISKEGSIEARRVPVDPSKAPLSSGRLNPPLKDFSARITLLSSLSTVQTGAEILMDMEVENTGAETWGAYGKQLINVSYHWYDSKGNVIEFDGLRTSLPRDLRPGERARIYGLLRSPHRVGSFRLVWTMVQEGVAWFEDKNHQSQCSVDVAVN